jgi:hypothetical protein
MMMLRLQRRVGVDDVEGNGVASQDIAAVERRWMMPEPLEPLLRWRWG